MGMVEGKSQLAKAVRELKAHWAEAKAHWDDETSRAFENRHLVPLEMDHRQAMGAMDEMGQILQQIRRDCQP